MLILKTIICGRYLGENCHRDKPWSPPPPETEITAGQGLETTSNQAAERGGRQMEYLTGPPLQWGGVELYYYT